MSCKKYLKPSSFIFDTVAQRTSKSLNDKIKTVLYTNILLCIKENKKTFPISDVCKTISLKTIELVYR